MQQRSKVRLIVLSIVGLAVLAGGVAWAALQPGGGPNAWRVTLEVLNGHQHVTVAADETVAPTPTPVPTPQSSASATPAPTRTPLQSPSSTPCPNTISASGSHISISCSSRVEHQSADGTSVTMSNTSIQSSTSGSASNSDHSSINVTITNQ